MRDIKRITSHEEYEEFYPHHKRFIKNYPKEYPCICWWQYRGETEYCQAYVVYYPNNISVEEAFWFGLTAKPEEL
jgi:hypothetical protein